jgi:hypothetical protein
MLASCGLTVESTVGDWPVGSGRQWVWVVAPWDQYNRDVKPGIYLAPFDDIETFMAAYRVRYPC